MIELTPAEIGAAGRAASAPRPTGSGSRCCWSAAGCASRTASVRDRVLRFFARPGSGVVVEVDDPPDRAADAATTRPVSGSSRRAAAGRCIPAEIVKMLAPAHSDGAPRRAAPAAGDFAEHDLDADGRLVPVDRPPATNPAGIVVGVDPQLHRALPGGHAAGDAARRPDEVAGLARRAGVPRGSSPPSTSPRSCGVPLEWFALSAGAKIAMDSGTENMDWIAAVLRRIIEFTQARRRAQRRRRRDQRRRSAVLERRGDDADAHPGHPRDDARRARWC